MFPFGYGYYGYGFHMDRGYILVLLALLLSFACSAWVNSTFRKYSHVPLLKAQAESGKIAAICASPAVVLAPLGILDGLEATCYPGMESGLDKAIRRDVPVVALDRVITANGPASTLRFALAIVANSMGEAIAQQVGSGLLYYPRSVNFYF